MKTVSDNEDMTKSFRQIYKMLAAMDKGLDIENFNAEKELAVEKFKDMTKTRWKNYFLMLQNAGYIEGIKERDFIDTEEIEIDVSDARITLSGLQFLAENSILMRTYNAVKEIKDFIPKPL